VVEFNCRFGDPETQVILPLLTGGLTECLYRVARGERPSTLSSRRSTYGVTTVLAARGYPDSPEKGAEIRIPRDLPDGVTVFHAGTARDSGGVLRSAGGRVLNVTAVASTFAGAQTLSREGAEAVEFEGKVFRGDIGWREARRTT
jgi:phosphoribosylamine--glycine ligase